MKRDTPMEPPTTPKDTRSWHYDVDGQPIPATLDHLTTEAADGVISDETLIWSPKLQKWLPLSELRAGEDHNAPTTKNPITPWVLIISIFPFLNHFIITSVYQPLTDQLLSNATGLIPAVTAFLSITITFTLLVLPVIKDRQALKASNRFAPHAAWGVFLAPVYLHQRATRNKHTTVLLYVWVASLLAYALLR